MFGFLISRQFLLYLSFLSCLVCFYVRCVAVLHIMIVCLTLLLTGKKNSRVKVRAHVSVEIRMVSLKFLQILYVFGMASDVDQDLQSCSCLRYFIVC